MSTKPVHALGGAIFLLGVLLGLGLALVAVWSDYEGFSYFNSGAGYPAFNGLVCPILMTRSEKSVVTAYFKNSTDQEFEPYYEVAISGSVSSRKLEGQLAIPPHTTNTIQWKVDSTDIDLGFFIFVDMQVLPVAGYQTREDTCGIMVLDLIGPTGGQVFGLTLATSLLGMVLGLGLWENNARLNINRYTNRHRALQAQGLAVLLALLTGLVGLWAAGLIFCVLAILLLVINLRQSIES
jgi:hypothetical protein